MNECILVVDDDPEIVRAIAILLEKEGYQVLKAYNGMEALEQAVNPALRLIIIDVMMPRLDGLSAVMKIREKRNLPIIVLSAKSEDSDKVLGLSMGADDYIAKPFRARYGVGLVLATLLVLTAGEAANSWSQTPPNRGDVTVAEFAENYNRQAEYLDFGGRAYLDDF